AGLCPRTRASRAAIAHGPLERGWFGRRFTFASMSLLAPGRRHCGTRVPLGSTGGRDWSVDRTGLRAGAVDSFAAAPALAAGVRLLLAAVATPPPAGSPGPSEPA